jgi:GNAT superfamily N-acetyltransferase
VRRRPVQLTAIAPEEYSRDVLPRTYALWGAGRTYDAYVADFLAIATSRYGRRRKHTIGIYEDGLPAVSCKLYPRELHWGERTLRAVGIGAVYTQENLRGRGFASALLGALLDAEVAAGTDVAYLFSDIRPAFYARLGFLALPSRVLSVRATSLDGSKTGAAPVEDRDWPAIRRCFDALERERTWGFRRTPTVWEWIRLKWRAPVEGGTQAVNLVARSGRSINAYVFGRRVTRRDAFVVDEFGYADDAGRKIVPAVIRAAAGDLSRVSGWLPPEPARGALPRGSVKARASAIFMLAPISGLGRAWWKANGTTIRASDADPIWSADHV